MTILKAHTVLRVRDTLDHQSTIDLRMTHDSGFPCVCVELRSLPADDKVLLNLGRASDLYLILKMGIATNPVPIIRKEGGVTGGVVFPLFGVDGQLVSRDFTMRHILIQMDFSGGIHGQYRTHCECGC